MVSIDDLISGDVLWEKWQSDSLYDVIDDDNYINVLLDTGVTNILLPPHSINVANSVCSFNENGDSICDLVCNEDLNFDGFVGVQDLLSVLTEFGCTTLCEYDVNQDGFVSIEDILQILSEYGMICE